MKLIMKPLEMDIEFLKHKITFYMKSPSPMTSSLLKNTETDIVTN